MSSFPVIDKVLEIHADEIAFLYAQRKNAIKSPVFYLNDITHLDNRISGHVDGLLLGGEKSWQFCEQGLDFQECGEVFTAAYFSINCKDFTKLDLVFEVAGEDPELLDAISDAFIWSNYEDVKLPLSKLAKIEDDGKRYVAINALSGFRFNPSAYNQCLVDSLKSDNTLLYQCALNAIGELGILDFKPFLEEAMKSDDENVLFAASWSATRFGDSQAMDQLKGFVSHPVYGERALQLVLLQKNMDSTIEILRELYQHDETKRLSILGLGYIGKANSIQQLIHVMENPELSRIAGFAFTTLTGIDLEQADLVAEQPDDFSTGPSEEAEEEDVGVDPDEDLPWPDVEKLKNWWSLAANQNRFLTTERYLAGKPFSKLQLQRMLRSGNQQQRIFSANCLSAYERNKPIFNVFSPAKYQTIALTSYT